MLHVYSNGIQIQAASSMEPNHFALRRCRREKVPYLLPERTELPPTCVKSKRLYNLLSLAFTDVTVISRYTSQYFVWIIQFYLQIQPEKHVCFIVDVKEAVEKYLVVPDVCLFHCFLHA